MSFQRKILERFTRVFITPLHLSVYVIFYACADFKSRLRNFHYTLESNSKEVLNFFFPAHISLQGSGEKLCQALFVFNIDIFHANEDKAIRRLRDKFDEEQKRVCQTMGWRDYNQGNFSAFDGDLGPVEVKMRQII